MAADAVRAEPRSGSGLGWLLGARLLLAGMSLGLAVTLDRIEGTQGPGIWGVYWTIVAAFVATIGSALRVDRTRNPDRFATLQVAIDVAIVTALVYFSGGRESVFTFLYALVVLYGALLLDRGGVAFSVGLAALAYGFVLFGVELGWLPALRDDARSQPTVVLLAYWAFYAGGLLMLGMLANTLVAELRRTGAALESKTSDLEHLRDLHRFTVESIGSGIATIDHAGLVTSFNPEAERITGLFASEAEGRPLEAVMPGALSVIEAREANAPRDTGPGRDRIAFRNERGEDLFVGLSASRLLGPGGERLGHVVIFQDVTAVVSMEQELRRSERLAAVGEMAARMAHEIRNPLASISGSVQLLQGSGASAGSADPAHDKLMGIVVREVDRLNALIGDFLRYSRPAPLALEAVPLAELVREVAGIAEGRSSHDVRVELACEESVVVLADPAQLKGALWNLWNNACEAMNGKGTLRIRVTRTAPGMPPQDERLPGRNAAGKPGWADRRAKGRGVLELEDTGPGMTSELQDRIFEPFFTTKQDGTGLGLATVQRIVEQHGGSIEIESEVGRGTRFRLLLPLAEEGA
ncbi:MAG: PAS domain S-box protein [Deltaproteobacteria bacterium]|nr:PAS domain S-box protein [Deltaproteobacteria bacterium]